LVHEASADQKEGRLGTELLRIRRLFERLEYDQLVLLDELCSGTNPSEGEQIVELVISLLTRLRPQALITTHFLQFAERLSKQPPIEDLRFLQVSLDPHLHPLYQFVPGVASTSLASQTAERLGVTREALETLIESKRDTQ
jgi:DNA mismatch repair protein MutS2